MRNPDALFGRLGNRLFQMAYIYSQMRKGDLKDIYVQDFSLFERYLDEIRSWLGEGIGLLPYVAVHLRVGGNPSNPEEPNYSENPMMVNLSKTGYYIDATNLFPGRRFLVFSDNMDLAKSYFEGDKFAFDDGSGEPHDVLNRMASCDGHIIANSSFSYWGAMLSPHHGRVVRPKLWFSEGSAAQPVTFPQDWIAV